MADKVLMRMGKPKNSVYREFVKEYKQMNEKLGKDQYLVPYLMSSHPGSSMKEAVELAEYLRDLGLYAGAGAGLLSNTVYHLYLHVLYRL